VIAQLGRPWSPQEAINHFSSPEELLHTINADHGRLRLVAACARGRHVADQYRGTSVAQLVSSQRVRLALDSWTACRGGILCFAESDLRASTVTVNCALLAKIARLLEGYTELGRWRTEGQMREVVLAHELYHHVTGRPTSRATEVEAHAFTRRLLGMPFSPTLFEWAARQAYGGVWASRNVHEDTTVRN
jgi:hypothetical protein